MRSRAPSAAVLVLTPVLWQHYLVLLIVSLRIVRPRFSAIWLLPNSCGWVLEPVTGTDCASVLPLLVVLLVVLASISRLVRGCAPPSPCDRRRGGPDT